MTIITWNYNITTEKKKSSEGCLKTCTFLPICCCRAQEEFEARAESNFSTVKGSLRQLVNSKVKISMSSLTESILYMQDVNTPLYTKYTKDSFWDKDHILLQQLNVERRQKTGA